MLGASRSKPGPLPSIGEGCRRRVKLEDAFYARENLSCRSIPRPALVEVATQKTAGRLFRCHQDERGKVHSLERVAADENFEASPRVTLLVRTTRPAR